MNFQTLVSAHDFKWNRAGKVNAMGVQVKAPKMERNLSSLSPSRIVMATVAPTITVLVMFLSICLLLVFSILSYKMFSTMMFAGYKTSGQLNNKLIENRNLTIQVMALFGSSSVIRGVVIWSPQAKTQNQPKRTQISATVAMTAITILQQPSGLTVIS